MVKEKFGRFKLNTYICLMIIKHAITYIDKTGLRVLAMPNQNRYFFNTTKQAEQRLKDIRTNTSTDTITSIFGEKPQFEVRPVEMWCKDGDAKRTIFNN